MSGSDFLGEKMPQANVKIFAKNGASHAVEWGLRLEDADVKLELIEQLRSAADQLEASLPEGQRVINKERI